MKIATFLKNLSFFCPEIIAIMDYHFLKSSVLYIPMNNIIYSSFWCINGQVTFYLFMLKSHECMQFLME